MFLFVPPLNEPKQDSPEIGPLSLIPGPFRKGLSRLLDAMARTVRNPRLTWYLLCQRIRGLVGRIGVPLGANGNDSAELRASAARPAGERKGITIVVLSFERVMGLASLIETLLMQELGDLQIELIICNNSPRFFLTKSRYSRIGRVLSQVNDLKLFNSSYNWRCKVRYGLALLGSYETIMFIDDDIRLLDRNLVRLMYDSLCGLGPMDIVSCWNTLWVEWGDHYLSHVSLTFEWPEITELTQSDTVGAGICMFNKGILLSQRILNLADEFPRADDMAFGPVASREWGSKCYYVPSYGKLTMHEDHRIHALYAVPKHYDDLYSQYKGLIREGYCPVLSRFQQDPGLAEHPEWRAVRMLPHSKVLWT
jgi:hypothetical protein